LHAPAGSGPLRGTETEELNATLLAWPAGKGPAEHVNSDRDVIVVVLAGQATVALDSEPHVIGAGEALVLEKNRSRSITAGPGGRPLPIDPPAARAADDQPAASGRLMIPEAATSGTSGKAPSKTRRPARPPSRCGCRGELVLLRVELWRAPVQDVARDPCGVSAAAGDEHRRERVQERQPREVEAG